MKHLEEAAKRLELALDMHETGVAMMREKFRRENPGLSPQEIEALVGAWLRDMPPDGGDRIVSWPRSTS